MIIIRGEGDVKGYGKRSVITDGIKKCKGNMDAVCLQMMNQSKFRYNEKHGGRPTTKRENHKGECLYRSRASKLKRVTIK